jgi:hypothetical protein
MDVKSVFLNGVLKEECMLNNPSCIQSLEKKKAQGVQTEEGVIRIEASPESVKHEN